MIFYYRTIHAIQFYILKENVEVISDRKECLLEELTQKNYVFLYECCKGFLDK